MNKLLKDKLGFVTAPLGNMFCKIPEEEAMATPQAAWEQDIRYFDTAPFYGAGNYCGLLCRCEAKPDLSLLAGRYTLLDHEKALQRLMPSALKEGMAVVVGGPYSSGILAGGTHFEYQKASSVIIEKAEKI